MQVHSDYLEDQKPEEKRSWNLLNLFVAGFIFFAIAYPMPTQSKLGFLSPFLVGLLGLLLILYFFKNKTLVYWNKYALKIFALPHFLFLLFLIL